MLNNLSLEENLLLLTSKITCTSLDIEESKNIINYIGFNWYDFIGMAIKNKVLLIVYYNLKNWGLDSCIPNVFKCVMRDYYQCNLIRNKVLLAEFSNVKKILETQGVLCCPLKGIYLLETIYADLGVRLLNDIDCLVNYKDEFLLNNIMENNGYIQGSYNRNTNVIEAAKNETKLVHQFSMNGFHPYLKTIDNQFVRYISFDFSYRLDFQADVESADFMLSNCTSQSNLKKEDFLLHLCIHLYKEAKNMWFISMDKDCLLIKFCDIREYVLKNMPFDLNYIKEFSSKYNFEDAMFYSLYYTWYIYRDENIKKILDKIKCNYNILNQYGGIENKNDNEWKSDFWTRLFRCSNRTEVAAKSNYKYFEDE